MCSYRSLGDRLNPPKAIETIGVHCPKGYDAIVTSYDDGRKGVRCPGVMGKQGSLDPDCVMCPYGDFLEG